MLTAHTRLGRPRPPRRIAPRLAAPRPALVALTLLGLSLAACNESSGPATLTVQMIDPAGGNAAANVVAGTLDVQIRQGEEIRGCDTTPCAQIRNMDFDLVLPIQSADALTFIHARIEGDSEHALLFGAVPGFVISQDGGLGELPIRVVFSPPDQCHVLAPEGVDASGPPRLPRPVRDAAVAIRRNLALLVGGQETDRASERAVRFDQLVVQTIPLDAVEQPVGPARGLTLSEDHSLIVGDTVLLYELRRGPPEPTIVNGLHDGVGYASSLVALPEHGAILGGDATREITWLTRRGIRAREQPTQLVTERAFAAATALGSTVLVVGGNAPGTPNAELVEPLADGVDAGLDEAALPPGSGGYLVESPSGASALWIGWAHPDGTPSSTTVLITGCTRPSGCVASEGPAWPRPRLEAAATRTFAGVFWILGGSVEGADGPAPSAFTDTVRWDGETPTIAPGPPLVAARAGGTAFAHISGIVTIAGGQGTDGLRDDFELCFPAALDPI